MKRLAAAALLAAAVTPVATATALPPRHPAVTCTMRYVVDETDLRDFLWCLSLREA